MFLLRWGSSVTGLRAGRPGFDSQQGRDIFLFVTVSRRTLEPTQPSIQWVPWAFFPGVKRQGREADHLHLIPNEWSYTSIPLTFSRREALFKHKKTLSLCYVWGSGRI